MTMQLMICHLIARIAPRGKSGSASVIPSPRLAGRRWREAPDEGLRRIVKIGKRIMRGERTGRRTNATSLYCALRQYWYLPP
jgi:hypothetical protein